MTRLTPDYYVNLVYDGHGRIGYFCDTPAGMMEGKADPSSIVEKLRLELWKFGSHVSFEVCSVTTDNRRSILDDFQLETVVTELEDLVSCKLEVDHE